MRKKKDQIFSQLINTKSMPYDFIIIGKSALMIWTLLM